MKSSIAVQRQSRVECRSLWRRSKYSKS